MCDRQQLDLKNQSAVSQFFYEVSPNVVYLAAAKIGCSIDIPILDLAKLIKKVVDFKGEILFDTTKPDGPSKSSWIVTKSITLVESQMSI